MTAAVSHAHARRSGPPPSAQTPPAATSTTGASTSRIHRKPFSSLMKRLAGLKNSHHNSSSGAQNGSIGSKVTGSPPGQVDNNQYKGNSHPDCESKPHAGKHRSNSHPGIPTPLNTTSTVNTITGPSYEDLKSHRHHHQSLSAASAESAASDSSASSPSSAPKPSNHTITTTATSLKSPSTFSSPSPSIRSLTTTLTTIQSTAPNLGNGAGYNPHPSHHHNPHSAPVLFNNPLPSPSHLHPSSTTTGSTNQVYYSANGLLTDNASIITLASSSKRRRRHSFDTDASIRALAPASVWGGSRESLPLSILSSMDNDRATTGSIRIPGDRSSLYGRLGGDGASIRGIHSPGINSPISGSVGGGGEYFLQGKENYSVVGGSTGNAGAGSATGTHGHWSGIRSRGSSAWREVHPDEDEDGGLRRDDGEEDEDDGGSIRSRRTASIASGKTGRTEEEVLIGGSGVIAIGANGPAPVMLNKGKDKL